MSLICTSLLVLAFAAPSEERPVVADQKKPTPKFTVGKETTFVTGPLDKDGYIDYAAALNERLGKGITPKTNAMVLFWKAFGAAPEVSRMPSEYFKLLRIEPPKSDNRFIGISP